MNQIGSRWPALVLIGAALLALDARSLVDAGAGAEREDHSGTAAGQPVHDESIVRQNSGDPLPIEAVVWAVRTNHPAIKAAAAHWEAAKQRIPQARAWEDPHVGVDVERSSTRFNSFADAEWMIAQEIPLTGKNRLRGESALAEALAAFEAVRRQELDLTAKARTAYYQLANAWEQLDLNDRNTSLLNQFVTISRAKYEAGTAPQSDVLIAETDLAKLQESRFDIERDISAAESQLNVLMNRPARSPLGRPARPALLAMHWTEGSLEALALQRRPELLIAQKKVEAAEARYKLARREWFPDPEIRVEARQLNGRSGIQEYDTGLFLRFPWVNHRKYKAAIEEARQMKLGAQHELEGLEKETLGLVRDQLKTIETFHHHAVLFHDKIVPLARQNITATRSAYESDQAGFLNLIDAQRTFYEVESMYWHHVTAYLSALAELGAVIGAERSPHAEAAREGRTWQPAPVPRLPSSEGQGVGSRPGPAGSARPADSTQ